MKKKYRKSLSTVIGPSVLLLTTTLILLFIAPKAAKEIQWNITKSHMHQASFRLNDKDNSLLSLSNASKDLATFVEPSVVHISANKRGRRGNLQQVGVGSGWIWDDEGHIITNWHVIEDASEAEILFHDGTTIKASLIGADRLTDIALLKAKNKLVHPASRAASKNPTLPGELVFAFGSPFGYAFSVSSGIVSAVGRSVSSIGMQQYQDFIQVDAAINQGNSGGPLTNCLGEVIGMNTAIIASPNSRGGGNFAGIGLAIPIEMIESVVDQILESGSVDKGFLGIGINDPDSPLQAVIQALGLSSSGVLLTNITPEKPLHAMGVRSGDVLLEYTNIPVLNKTNFSSVLERSKNIENINLLVQRYDSLRDRPIQLLFESNSKVSTQDLFAQIKVLNLNEPLREHLEAVGLPSQGILINSIQENSAAEKAGLPKGGLIIAINENPVNLTNQLTSRISSLRPGTEIILKIALFDPENCTIETKNYKVILNSRKILSNFIP